MAQQTLSSPWIRPRRFALGLVVITVAMLVAAINYGNNLIFLIAFMMIALMVNSAWQGWRALSSLDVRIVPPAMRAAGESGSFVIELTGPGRGLPSLWIDAGQEEALHSPATAEAQASVAVPLPGEPRGYLPLPEIGIETPFPLGLWRIGRRAVPGVGQWVHPAPLEGETRGRISESDDTGARVALEGDPTRLRAYHPGDPIRHVVFRHYAKTGQLVTRQPEAEGEEPDPEIIDYETFVGPRETRLSAMTERLMDLDRQRRPWVLRLPGENEITATTDTDRARRYRTALQRLARFGRPRDDQGFDHLAPGEPI